MYGGLNSDQAKSDQDGLLKVSEVCRSTRRSCLRLLAILLVAGCTSAQMEPYVTVDEKAACDRGVATQNRQVIERVITDYPNSGCVGSMLSAQPSSVLRQLSPAVIGQLPPSTIETLPSSVMEDLNLAKASTPTK
jgi:hypothetical protein